MLFHEIGSVPNIRVYVGILRSFMKLIGLCMGSCVGDIQGLCAHSAHGQADVARTFPNNKEFQDISGGFLCQDT